jgi:hypothetical protein
MTRKHYPYVESTAREVGDIIVIRYGICTTSCIVYVAVEKGSMSQPTWRGTHTSFHDVPGRPGEWFGSVTSRNLPDDIEALQPMTRIRSEKVHAYQAELAKIAIDAIFTAYPHLRDIPHRITDWMGQIETEENDTMVEE